VRLGRGKVETLDAGRVAEERFVGDDLHCVILDTVIGLVLPWAHLTCGEALRLDSGIGYDYTYVDE
jgi:hypothetical protein